MFLGRIKYRRGVVTAFGVAVIYLLLLIPESAPPPVRPAAGQPFVWARKELWQQLEQRFREARNLSPAGRAAGFQVSLERVQRSLDLIAETNLPPGHVVFDELETNFFQCAVLAAVTPERDQDFQREARRLAELAKWQSQSWSMDFPAARQRLYRLLYGRRAAAEAVLLQLGAPFNPLEILSDAGSAENPAAEVQGVRLQSGDILVSRGGAATSALIARGNDYRGNFSHVALLHVDEATKQLSVIEARIECGVKVRSFADYLADTKLRIMVLRLRDDLPAVVANPQLPHLAATLARTNALAQHIPYDFTMNYADPTQQFCSEVVSSAYQTQGVTLWSGLSQISAPGLTRWLAILGVRNFSSEQPSDLEYDPQLRFVAEWRNPDTLLQDHVDNAIIDARLEAAEEGASLEFNRWFLPPMRMLKAGCWVLNQVGLTGPIPEGMSATTALRVEKFKQRHAQARQRLQLAITQFQKANGYMPPDWELLPLARLAIR